MEITMDQIEVDVCIIGPASRGGGGYKLKPASPLPCSGTRSRWRPRFHGAPGGRHPSTMAARGWAGLTDAALAKAGGNPSAA